jgi:hypothetical protein
MADDIDQFLDGADIRGTEHRAEARKVLQSMLNAAEARGKLEGARAMIIKFDALMADFIRAVPS